MTRLSWTNPVCVQCWNERNPDRQAIRTRINEAETCCYCGNTTRAGIYVRVDPTTVAHPRHKED